MFSWREKKTKKKTGGGCASAGRQARRKVQAAKAFSFIMHIGFPVPTFDACPALVHGSIVWPPPQDPQVLNPAHKEQNFAVLKAHTNDREAGWAMRRHPECSEVSGVS